MTNIASISYENSITQSLLNHPTEECTFMLVLQICVQLVAPCSGATSNGCIVYVKVMGFVI